MKKLILLSGLSILLASCGGSKKEVTPLSSEETSATKEADVNAPVTAITIKGNDNMKYDITEFTVKKGQEVTITLDNVGQLPKEAMGHNLIVLKPGTDVDTFAKAAEAEVKNDYIPSALSADIIAHTKLLGPGEQDSITLTFTDAGDYTYICSYPNHYVFMRGTIHVVE